MNQQQFLLYTSQDCEWETNNVRRISIDFIHGSEEASSQVRQGGIDNQHLSELQDSLVRIGQEVPITVEITGLKNEKGQTIYRLIDGGHRYLAFQNLRKKNKNDLRWTMIRAYITEFNNEYERNQYQYHANEHTLPAKSNSNDDVALWLNYLITTGFPGAPPKLQKLKDSQHRNRTEPKEYREELLSVMLEKFPNIGTKRRVSIVDGFLKKTPGKFKTWNAPRSKSSLDEFIRDNNIEMPDNYDTVIVRETNHVFHSAAGNSLSLLSEDNNNKIIAIVFTNKTAGRDSSDIDRERIKTLKEINRLNSHRLLSRGSKLIDMVFIAPQKIEEGDCQEIGFYQVNITSKNRFSLSVPTQGWNTEIQQKLLDAVAAK